MRPNIINACKKTYRIDVEKFVKNIVRRIPGKFLDGLDHICLLDFGKEDYPMCRYVVGNGGAKRRRIEIYLDNPDLTRIPFFSPLAINIHLLLAINRHIEHLKTKTEDQEVLSVNTSKIDYGWMYLGIWDPLLAAFNFLRYSVAQSRLFKTLLKKWTNNLIGKTGTRDHPRSLEEKEDP
ncbi:MAG: hypothetical protein GTO24_09850 [candidate division Zixibacteria bacterium]|nr:hypothetical protein [candidate division Zixibacteria bacterium]